MNIREKLYAIVPAAGSGQRFGGKIAKQYSQIEGIPVIEHTLRRLISFNCFEKIIVCIAPNDDCWDAVGISKHKLIEVVTGGDTRAQSVMNGLSALRQMSLAGEWVMVHDAARPCVTEAEVRELVSQVSESSVGGLLALPVVDTVKQSAEHNQIVKNTLDRSCLWLAQTPQMFRIDLLSECLQSALEQGHSISDEASAIELAGYRPILVPGLRSNIKITQAEDLALAAYHLGVQKSTTK